MREILIGFASILFSTFGGSPSLGDESRANAVPWSNVDALRYVFPDNIDCRDFARTAYKVWRLRDRSFLDLGNWDGAFKISGPISPGLFVKKGFDLFDVLEAKCEVSAERVRYSPARKYAVRVLLGDMS